MMKSTWRGSLPSSVVVLSLHSRGKSMSPPSHNRSKLRGFIARRLGIALTTVPAAFLVILGLAALITFSNSACGSPASRTPPKRTRPAPTHTDTPSSTAVPTATPTPSPTPTSTPTLSPTVAPSPTPTSTPIPPPTATLAPPRVITPEPVAPAQGKTYRNPITFEWSGALSAGQRYLVSAHHTVSGYVVQSELLTDQTWTTDLPAENYGEWRWTVSVVQRTRTVITSNEWMFWFDPSGDGGDGGGDHPPSSTRIPPSES